MLVPLELVPVVLGLKIASKMARVVDPTRPEPVPPKDNLDVPALACGVLAAVAVAVGATGLAWLPWMALRKALMVAVGIWPVMII